MHCCSAINVRAHQIAAAATAPAASACIYRSCACRELVVVFENLKPLSGVQLGHALTSLNRCDRVFLRCCDVHRIIKHNTQYSQNWSRLCCLVIFFWRSQLDQNTLKSFYLFYLSSSSSSVTSQALIEQFQPHLIAFSKIFQIDFVHLVYIILTFWHQNYFFNFNTSCT